MEPAVGRIVHYQSLGTPNGEYLPAPYPAMIVEVWPGVVTLCVFYNNGISFKQEVKFAESPTGGHWNWPPRVG